MARHLVGVPRARDLVVNGVPTKPGSPHAAVRRIYQSAIRPLAETSQPGDLVLVKGGDIEGARLCAWCFESWCPGDSIVIERSTGRWWHMTGAPSCRKLWLDHHQATE